MFALKIRLCYNQCNQRGEGKIYDEKSRDEFNGRTAF